MSMKKIVETISEMATDMKEGVYVSEGKVWDEDEKHEEVLITDKAKLLLCSERCMRKEHYGTLYTLPDGDMIFVCNFARERDTHPISLVFGQLDRATKWMEEEE